MESYLDIYFAKYVCPHEDCGGTLIPLPGSEPTSGAACCNVCGMLRSEKTFQQQLADLQQPDAA